MGIMDRIKLNARANLNHILSKAENPQKMLDQFLMEMRESVQEVREAVTTAVVGVKKLEREISDSAEKAAQWEERATLALQKENEELARLKKPLKNIPQFISMMQLSDEVLAKAEADIKEALKAQGKPEQIWDKIVPGQLARFIDDNTTLDKELALLDQTYVLDDKMTVAQAVQAAAKELGGTAEIVDFVRFEVGEGIEKKVDDFAAEVAAQMG